MSEVRHYSQERVELSRAYPGKKWVEKVAKMSDAQVHASLVRIRQQREQKKNGA